MSFLRALRVWWFETPADRANKKDTERAKQMQETMDRVEAEHRRKVEALGPSPPPSVCQTCGRARAGEASA